MLPVAFTVHVQPLITWYKYAKKAWDNGDSENLKLIISTIFSDDMRSVMTREQRDQIRAVGRETCILYRMP